MKKILRSTAIISALAIMLTGCGEQESSRVLNIYGGTQSSAVNAAPLAHNQVKSEANENADNTDSASVVNNAENANSDPNPTEPPIIGTDGGENNAPSDFITESSYDAFEALKSIVDTARTVEILKEEVAKYNKEYPEYAVNGIEVTDRGDESVASGLLKNGMGVHFIYDDGGSADFAVIRADKCATPDEAYYAYEALIKIVDTAQTVEIFEKEFARYNEKFPDYAIGSFEITDGGEPVTSGLLKDGMSIHFFNADGSSHSQAAVIRAPKDIIPDDAPLKNVMRKDEDFPDIIQPKMETGSFEDSLRYIMLRAETVEDLERDIAELDIESRVIGVKVTKKPDNGKYSKGGVTVTEGALENDMTVSVTYDDNKTGLQYYVGHYIDRYYGQIISTGEFEKGIWDAIDTAETVGELKRLIAEHDVYERVDSVNVYTDGSMTEEVTEGAFTSGMRYYIEYDNRRSNMVGQKV